MQAIDPQRSASVSASAGTGKTWLLVSRMMRLLLNGANPDTILAITFTRKAAAEMQSRLNERLLVLATCDDNELEQQLNMIGAPINSATISSARSLYESLLHNSHPPRITTFHAFCQDILKRFPFEANVPPGFELLEQTAELASEAWDVLFNEATRQPDSEAAQALETLFDNCHGISNTTTALQSFLNHRSDWWAYTLGNENPVTYAQTQLKQQLQITDDQDPAATFFNDENVALAREFADLLAKHNTATNTQHLDTIHQALDLAKQEEPGRAFDQLADVFFTSQGEPRKRKSSKAQMKNMGTTGDARFIELHEIFCERIKHVKAQRARLNTFMLSQAWYKAGQQLLTHYQHIKQERRLLDFTDLEWNTYLLLNEEQNALWVQYKLDARINHILVDEFQDTNPTQWRLLLPLLEELAAQQTDQQTMRSRSVFLVGDSKQSIYRFRRAQPKLFDIAQEWLHQRINAHQGLLDTSRRSSQAVMDFVNQVFGDGELHTRLVHFTSHKTHLDRLWGHVEVLPLFDNPKDKDDGTFLESGEQTSLRNPLLTPRVLEEDKRRTMEAAFIAEKINELITAKTIVGEGVSARPLRYDDVIILLRHRTHAAIYERALMHAGIPYLGIDKGTLLETLETRDVMALLETLMTPFSNLALAQVLKSPVFDFTDEDLIELAAFKGDHWLQRLEQLALGNPNNSRVTRAATLLKNWQSLTGKLPVHDLLDKIYSDSNLIARYVAAYPSHLQHRVVSNLNRFIELALEIDSGRYPSVGRFLYRLQLMRSSEQDAPDQTPAGTSDARVRLLTIHGAKGLEAPVIFLADSANTTNPREAYRAIVAWPAEHQRPQHFLMSPKKADRDDWTQQLLTEQESAAAREDANLLYVAVTRAKQWLFITGTAPGQRADQSWYAHIVRQLRHHNGQDSTATDGDHFVLQAGEMTKTKVSATQPPPPIEISIDRGLSRPLHNLTATGVTIAPSLVALDEDTSLNLQKAGPQDASDEDLQQRGIIIHKLLQWLLESRPRTQIQQYLAALAGKTSPPQDLDSCWQEAETIISHANLQQLFDSDQFETAYNEVPVSYRYGDHTVHGIIDRLVVTEHNAFVVDYKTHVNTDPEYQYQLTDRYRPQMSLYVHGIKQLWPDKSVTPYLLFTHNATLAEIEIHAISTLLEK
jgi:ATP-dependent helicase/nuclease subunit A